MKLIYAIFIGFLSLSCGTSAPIEDGFGTITGSVFEEGTDEPMVGATVVLVNSDPIVGASVDTEGRFKLTHVPSGKQTIQINYGSYDTKIIEDIKVESEKETDLGSIEMHAEIRMLKPMIYLYPEDTMDVEVALNYEGKLTHTYPHLDDSWKVKAFPDGTLMDAKGRSYYGLFWEGNPNKKLHPQSGFLVGSDTVVSFLENSLDQLGLTEREANEFIVFWLPELERSPLNLIYFAASDYTESAELLVTPKPESVIRVMMVYTPLQGNIEFPKQTLPEKPKRTGFTLVEWGGTKSTTVL